MMTNTVAESRQRSASTRRRIEATKFMIWSSRATLLRRRARMCGASDALPTEPEILEAIRKLINAGALPRIKPKSAWAGKCSEEHTCMACREIIRQGETEFEVDVEVGVTFFHPRCIAIWNREDSRDAEAGRPNFEDAR